jgi:aldehyde dehydrogenase (NAD+)
MLRLADLVEANKESLATMETWNGGKPYATALNEDVADVVETLRYYAGWADKIVGQTIPITPLKFAYTLKQPVGVVGQIIPWNYPLAMAAWKLGPALACGNTVVLKPAEQTPLSILVFSQLIRQAGFPRGVVNIVNGYGAVAGEALVSHTGLDKIAFTGSTATGKVVMRSASANLKNLTLETGGKSPLIVFNDADLDQAAKWGHAGIMSNQGQMCCATSRILVHEDAYSEYIERFRNICEGKTVGSPWHSNTFQGPQITKSQYDQILQYIETGKREGATLVTGGVPWKNVEGHKGFFIEPTVFSNVTSDMAIFKDEVFGPFVSITPFKTETEALRLANDSYYGLGAAVFTKDIERGHRVAKNIQAGMVWINSSNDVDFRVPFGGVKQSGIGRELGEAGLSGYYETKAVHVNLGCKL